MMKANWNHFGWPKSTAGQRRFANLSSQCKLQLEETLGHDRVCSNEIRKVPRVLGTANEAEKIGK